ncbi:MAG: response regulator [Proteobacteria bacterium]|nr:response regulator [Pseudomonadota bacterium]MBU1687993.1 response regulator [Pseudomonadota bacterium]
MINPTRLHSRLSLIWKITILITLVMLLLIASAGLLIEKRMKEALHSEIEEKGLAIARNLAADCVEALLVDDTIELHQLLRNVTQAEPDIAYLYVVFSTGQVRAHTFAQNLPPGLLSVNPLPPGQFHSHRIFRDNNRLIHDLAVPILGGQAGAIHMGLSQEHITERIHRVIIEITSIMVGLGVIVIIMILWTGKALTHSLTTMTSASRAIGRGELTRRIPQTDGEFGQLADDFNTMAENLEGMIRERDQAVGELKESEELYRSLVENIGLGISFISPDHTILMANTAQALLKGKAPTSLIGLKCFQAFEQRDEPCPDCPGSKSLTSHHPEKSQLKSSSPGGTPTTLSLRAFPIYTKDGSRRGFIQVTEDITTQEQIDRALQRNRNLDAIGILAGGIAHDFNNLLTVILGYIDLTMISLPPQSQEHEHLMEAKKACLQTKKLTGEFLTFAEGDIAPKEKVHLTELIEETCRFTLSGSNIGCRVDIPPPSLWPVEIARNQIRQVLQNLLLNAREAMGEAGGEITIQAENATIDSDSGLPVGAGHYVKITINDQGPGIDKTIAEQIFDPYFTTKPRGADKGTGLGLTICHSIVAKNGGHIMMDQPRGQGASFIIFLPALTEGARQPEQQPPQPVTRTPSPTIDQHHKRILVLEDEVLVSRAIGAMLHHLGYPHAIAERGEEILKMYQGGLTTGSGFDLVILDLTIRNGLGGQETMRRLLEIDPTVRAVVASGYSEDPVMAEYSRFGFLEAMPKPYSLEELRDLLLRLLA